MINLLPTEKKSEIRAARSNTILARYIGVLFVALLFISTALYVSQQSLKLSEESADKQLAVTQSTTTEGQGDTAALLANIASSQQTQTTAMSAILTSLAQALPTDVVIKSIEITPQQLQGGPLSITTYAKQESQAETIKTALESSGIFTAVSTTSTDSGSKDVQQHPVKITLSATISNNQTRGSALP